MSEQQKSIREMLGEAIGEASMCWSEAPKGVFDSARAEKIVNDLATHLERRVYLESLIKGHIEAMRPLLDEGSGRL